MKPTPSKVKTEQPLKLAGSPTKEHYAVFYKPPGVTTPRTLYGAEYITSADKPETALAIAAALNQAYDDAPGKFSKNRGK